MRERYYREGIHGGGGVGCHFHGHPLPCCVLDFSCTSHVKTKHCSSVGVINLGTKSHIWMGFSLRAVYKVSFLIMILEIRCLSLRSARWSAVTSYGGAKNNPSQFLILLVGLIIKLTWDRWTGESVRNVLRMYIWGCHRIVDLKMHWPLRFICHFGQSRRGAGAWDFRGDVDNLQGGRRERTNMVNKFLLGHRETVGHGNLRTYFCWDPPCLSHFIQIG